MSTLVDYITIEPKETDSNLVKHKYPFTACEILSCDINKINDYFSMTNEEQKSSRKNSSISEKETNDKKEESNEENGEKKENEGESKIEEVIEKKEESLENPNSIELMDKLLNFLNTKNTLNDVLCGYFTKVMNHLLSKYPFRILTYLYKYKYDALSNMIYHSYQTGISEICVKVLSLEIYMINTNVTESMKPIQEEYSNALIPRNKILFELIDLIKINSDEDISCKISLLQNLIETQKILEFFILNGELCIKIFEKIKDDFDVDNNYRVRTNLSHYLDFLCSVIKNSINFNIGIPTSEFKDNTELINHFSFSKELISNLNTILKYFRESKSNESYKTTFDYEVKPLGTLNMKIMELVIQLISYLKNIPKILDEELVRSHFMKTSIDFLFKYEWNNLYQQNFLNFFKQLMADEAIHPLLLHHLFHELNFTNLLISQLQTEKKYQFKNSKKEISSGYFSMIIYLCYKINAVGGGQAINIRSREGSFYFTASSTNEYQTTAFKLYDLNKMTSSKKNINLNISGEIKSCLNEDWVEIFKQQVTPYVKLYEMKLFDDSSNLEDEDENISEDNSPGYGNEKSSGETPFGQTSKENQGASTFFSGIEEDMNKGENENKVPEE